MCVTNALEIFSKRSIEIGMKTEIFIIYVFYKNKKIETTYIMNKEGII